MGLSPYQRSTQALANSRARRGIRGERMCRRRTSGRRKTHAHVHAHAHTHARTHTHTHDHNILLSLAVSELPTYQLSLMVKRQRCTLSSTVHNKESHPRLCWCRPPGSWAILPAEEPSEIRSEAEHITPPRTAAAGKTSYLRGYKKCLFPIIFPSHVHRLVISCFCAFLNISVPLQETQETLWWVELYHMSDQDGLHLGGTQVAQDVRGKQRSHLKVKHKKTGSISKKTS